MLEFIFFGAVMFGVACVIKLHDAYGDENAHADEARADLNI